MRNNMKLNRKKLAAIEIDKFEAGLDAFKAQIVAKLRAKKAEGDGEAARPDKEDES
jgi:hypothetical protein